MNSMYLSSSELVDSDFETVYDAYKNHMLLKNYSSSTISAYLSNFRRYSEWCNRNKIDFIYNQDHVKAYLIYRVKQGARWQTMNNIYSAMRKLFREVLEVEWSFRKLRRPKKERILPELISKEEVKRMIQACGMLKHKVIIVTLYATGMRSSELCNLKLQHIDGDRKQIKIVKGKGSKDRYIDVPEGLITLLRMYYRRYRPITYLFNGRKKGVKMSVSSLRWPIREAKRKMGLIKRVSPHTMRHCYATHHLESGTDLVYLQKNLGHKHLKTTARYIHLCKERKLTIHHPIADMMEDLFPQIMG